MQKLQDLRLGATQEISGQKINKAATSVVCREDQKLRGFATEEKKTFGWVRPCMLISKYAARRAQQICGFK